MKYFLIGNPVKHSFSARHFNEKFRRENMNSHYDLCELKDISELPALISEVGCELGGFNVTAPYKKEVIKYLNRLTPEVVVAGSVNCVRREADDTLTGHNTDIEGFGTLFDNNALPEMEYRKALIIGGGGVVGAVLAGLKERNITAKCVVRNMEKFHRFHPDTKVELLSLSELSKDDILEADIIINCTPLGTFPNVNTAPKIPYEYVQPRHLCLDLVYNPEQTVFTRICAAHGATAASGKEMLISQADAAWRFWNGDEL